MCRQINNEELDRVVGGITRTVDTNTSIDAVVRGGPGMQYGQIASLKDHTEVNTTGNSSYNQLDGKTWYEINYPVYGWMAGSLLGYRDR